jgi:hypothetical protein
MTIWRRRFACCIPKATNTLRLCNTYFFSTATMVERTHFNVKLHIDCLYCLTLQAHICDIISQYFVLFVEQLSEDLEKAAICSRPAT